MHLLIGQIVYTSLARMGFRSLASSQVPAKIQQAFIQQVAARHWDTYNPPQPGYRAVYLHQLTREQTLFGWLYNDGTDEINRSHVPYFICYYLAEPLLDFHLENIFTCLEKGPLELIERQNLPASLKNIVIQTPWTFNNDFWNYQPARPGVKIPSVTRTHSYTALKQGKLLNVFLSVQQQTVVAFAQTDAQKIAKSSSKCLAAGIKDTVLLNKDAAIETVAVTLYQGQTENLRRYEQALAEAIKRSCIIDDNTRRFLQSLQHSLMLTDEDVKLVEARLQEQIRVNKRLGKYTRATRRNSLPIQFIHRTLPNNQPSKPCSTIPLVANLHLKTALEQSAGHNFVSAYKSSQLLLGLGIAASGLALLGSIYGLLRTSMFEPRKPDLIPSKGVSYNLTQVSKVSPLLYNYGE